MSPWKHENTRIRRPTIGIQRKRKNKIDDDYYSSIQNRYIDLIDLLILWWLREEEGGRAQGKKNVRRNENDGHCWHFV